ncbi:MAG: hypothetical protein HY544_03015 [Candidatus Diapherotrites archaeon]|uniref:Large ribosomal subunit protein eL31 n=1 Tax=Candidatus Iainarchaeum sp. TaxID=3101447 RepID=A0A8T3YNR2_9ARCH|nr:hypothetical protein [Candidatus Diapherotrites archaeon]
MKGEQANYTIPLKKAFLFPPRVRIRKAIAEIRDFVKKHTRFKKYALSNEVNAFLHKNSKNIPHRIPAVLLKEQDRIAVFLQGGKEMETYIKQREEAKKRKEQKKTSAKKGAKEEKSAEAIAESKEAEDEKRKKLEDKKAKEEAAKAAEMKRGTA